MSMRTISEQQCVVEWRVPHSKASKKASKPKQWEVFDAMIIRTSGNFISRLTSDP